MWPIHSVPSTRLITKIAPQTHHTDPPYTAKDGTSFAVRFGWLLSEEEVNFVIIPIIIVWDQISSNKLGCCVTGRRKGMLEKRTTEAFWSLAKTTKWGGGKNLWLSRYYWSTTPIILQLLAWVEGKLSPTTSDGPDVLQLCPRRCKSLQIQSRQS